ncbi:Detected protein of confused Function [Hibiscus syriacus]|uniref:Detected protein of confused Function n=1 Tax=Hibiscus syriacus TaxID=106335 RepID=A0A6A3BYQ7_HIBSY|nr:Detected protein of confused Function [Hibiscus syriacus]
MRWVVENLKGKSVIVCILKLAWVGFLYFVWEECNHRQFRGVFRSIEEVVDCIRVVVRIRLQRATNSQLSFTADASVSPKKPTSLLEVAKQRELSGSLQSESDAKNKKISNAKYKEISAHDIFSSPPEIKPRSLAAAAAESRENKDMVELPAGGQTSILFTDEPVVKAMKKIHNQKFQKLTGTGIFKGDVPPGSAEKPLSQAKLREMSGNDIFSDGKAESRSFLGGSRKVPGGESSISLV